MLVYQRVMIDDIRISILLEIIIFAGAHVTFTLTKSLYILSSKPSADIQLTNLLWISPALVPLKWPVASWWIRPMVASCYTKTSRDPPGSTWNHQKSALSASWDPDPSRNIPESHLHLSIPSLPSLPSFPSFPSARCGTTPCGAPPTRPAAPRAAAPRPRRTEVVLAGHPLRCWIGWPWMVGFGLVRIYWSIRNNEKLRGWRIMISPSQEN